MMNAAMLIAPAPQMGSTATGGKTMPEHGQLFGQVMAQQQQEICQVIGQPFGRPETGGGLNNFSELLGKNAGDMLLLQPEQKKLLEQFEQLDIDMELLDSLALLVEQGMVPNSMDHAELQQLVNLVEEVLPQWQFHNQMVTAGDGDQPLVAEFGDLPPEQQIGELVALLHQYFVRETGDKEGTTISDRTQQTQQTQQSLTAEQKLEPLRDALRQMRTAMQQAGAKEDHPQVEKGVAQHRGADLVSADARIMDIPAKNHGDEETKSPLESRFSELLKPRQHHSAQARSGEQPVHYSQQPQQQGAATTVEEAVFTRVTDKTDVAMTMPNMAPAAKQAVDGNGQQPQFQIQQPPVAAAPTISAPTPVTAAFTGTQPLPDSQIFDQVVTHLSGSSKGEAGRMVLRLHPAELGALRIELMVEGDRVRANLHAQSQQVQEVLERNLGQLRSALAEQGLKIDHFQVSSDARQHQHQEQAQDLARRRAEDESVAESERQKQEDLPEDQHISLEHLLQNGGRGISLHV